MICISILNTPGFKAMPGGSGIIVACNLAWFQLNPNGEKAKLESYSCWYKYIP